MFDSPGKIRFFLYGIICLNIACIIVFFIFPRSKFMISNAHLSYSQLLETTGAPDMPNQLSKPFAIANRIKDVTPEHSVIFLPPTTRRDHVSSAILRLYPRQLFWGVVPESGENLKPSSPPAYFLSQPDWHPDYCANKARIKINHEDSWLCRIEEQNVKPPSSDLRIK